MIERYLVTGGAGFIGSRLVRKLSNHGRMIWVIDNLNPQVHGTSAVPPIWDTNVTFTRTDIRDRAAVEAILQMAQPEVIYHLAAETGTSQSYYEMSRYCDVNVNGTAVLLESVRNRVHSCLRRIVLGGSRAVYGEGPYRRSNGAIQMASARDPADMRRGQFNVRGRETDDPLEPVAASANCGVAPISVYASTKLMQEYLLKQGSADASWSPVILRFQNVYGPGQSLHNPYTGVLSIFCRQLLEGMTLNVYEDGEIRRDFVFVDDVVQSLYLSAKADVPPGATIDIGSGIATSLKTVATILIRLLNCPENRYRISGDFRVGDVRHALADISVAKELLSWKPATTLEDGLQQLLCWCRSELFKQE